MEAFLTYLLKSAALLSIFYLVYLLLLKNQTSFTENRKFLLGGIIASAVLPAVYFTQKVKVEANNFSIGEIPISTNTYSEDSSSFWGIWEIAGIIYFLIAAFFIIKIGFQLYNISKLIRESKVSAVENYKFIKTDADLNPFSFFRFIVYNPVAHSEKDLEMILQHEKIHASQWHSVDILIANLTTALLWFNPLSWLYKRSLEQNLEYIADRETVAISGAKKSYQQTLVKVSIPNLQPALTNQFYQSFIKKRILMLNKQSTQNFSLIRISFVFPLILAFMLTFNVKTEASNISTENNKTLSTTSEEGQKLLEAHFSESTSKASLDNYQDAFAEKNVKLEWRNIEYSANSLKNIHITYTLETGDSREFQSETDEDGIMIPFKISTQFHENGKVAFIAIGNKKASEPTNSQLVEHDVESIESKKLPEDLIYIIDGNIVSIEDVEALKPEEIAKMKVLKNESAISLYGEDAKDGAVIITTKDLEKSEKKAEKKVIKEKAHSVGFQNFERKSDDQILTNIDIRYQEDEDINAFQKHVEKSDSDEITGYEAKATIFTNGQQQASPLVVIDGKRETAEFMKSELQPEDTKKINVLKGAGAIEKYGEEAKDGVIEITTKKDNNTKE
ncbi:M56 family metallopeptidase [Salegentibacter sp.]|uniref:M56 family metallopeptidase n=1 Tax=Salegentibacter sp. TaxID=1903072 RepID=UPI00356433E0